MMPKGWTRKALAEVLEVKHGFAFQSEHFSASRTPFRILTPGNFSEEGGFRDTGAKQRYYSGPIPEDYVLRRGDLLVAMTEQAPGLLGSSLLVPEEETFLHNQRLGRVLITRPDLASRDYLYHLFNSASVRKRIAETAAGTKVRHTSPDRIMSVVCAFPPMQEQERLAQILSTADHAISTAQRLVTFARQFQQAVMQQLLTGKRRLPGFSGDWTTLRFQDLFREVHQVNEDEKVSRVITVGKEAIRPQLEHFTRSVASRDQSNYNILLPGDFVYDPMSAYYGAIGRYDDEAPGICSPVYRVLKVRDGFCSDYLKYLLRTHVVQFQLTARSTQGNKEGKRRSLPRAAFDSVKCRIPGQEEQQAIARVLSACDREISLLQRQLDLLKRQKRGLMQKLLTGQVRVKVKE